MRDGNTLIIQCDGCRLPSHNIQIDFEPEYHFNRELQWDREFTIHYMLIQYNSFWKRVWLAIKYIFKQSPKYGHFDTVCLSVKEIKEMVDFFQEKLKESPNVNTKSTSV